MASIVYNNLPHDPADFTDQASNFALGQFMTAWSQLEAVIGVLFAELSGIPREKADIIIDEVPNKDRITILERMAAISDDATRTALGPLISQTRTLGERRNRIVHAGWGTFNNERARYWHGLTSADFDEIWKETSKGQSLRAKGIFTMGDLARLSAEAVVLKDRLYTVYSTLAVIRCDNQRPTGRQTFS
jgi:hypothetical protein